MAMLLADLAQGSVVPGLQTNLASTTLLERRDSITEAYLDTNPSGTADDHAKQAFNNAVKYFKFALTEDERKRSWINSYCGMEDVLVIVSHARTIYNDSSSSSSPKHKAKKWLGKFFSYVNHYATVLDTLAQHHPEYVALAWGTIKFLFSGIINHAETVAQFSKALAKIGEALSRAELYLKLYSTNRMKEAVSWLYAHMIKFLCNAFEWYMSRKRCRLLHAYMKPFPLSYQETVQHIAELTAAMDDLARIAHSAETRDINSAVQHGRIENAMAAERIASLLQSYQTQSGSDNLARTTMIEQAINSKFLMLSAQYSDLDARILALGAKFDQFLQTAANSQTLNYRIGTGFSSSQPYMRQQQLAGALQRLAIGPDAEENFQTSVSNSGIPRQPIFSGSCRNLKQVLNDVQVWAGSKHSSLLILHAGLRAEACAKDITVKIVSALRDTRCNIIWHLSSPSSQESLSNIDNLLQYFAYQALKLSAKKAIHKIHWVDIATLGSSHSVDEWLDLIINLLDGLKKVYIVVEAEPLFRQRVQSDGPPDPDNPGSSPTRIDMGLFLKSSRSLIARADIKNVELKILVISYRAIISDQNLLLGSANVRATVVGEVPGNHESWTEIISPVRFQPHPVRQLVGQPRSGRVGLDLSVRSGVRGRGRGRGGYVSWESLREKLNPSVVGR